MEILDSFVWCRIIVNGAFCAELPPPSFLFFRRDFRCKQLHSGYERPLTVRTLSDMISRWGIFRISSQNASVPNRPALFIVFFFCFGLWCYLLPFYSVALFFACINRHCHDRLNLLSALYAIFMWYTDLHKTRGRKTFEIIHDLCSASHKSHWVNSLFVCSSVSLASKALCHSPVKTLPLLYFLDIRSA